MAKSLADLRMTKPVRPPTVLAYGVHGIGKTTFGSEWPDPVFIQAEEGEGNLEFPTFGSIETFDDVLDTIGSLLTGEHGYKTAVFDSADAIEPLLHRKLCADKGWPDIEHGTDGKSMFGKGYVSADALWLDYLDGCKALNAAGIAVVIIAHSNKLRFDSPTTDPYDRYEPKLQKRAAALVQEKADIVAFFNYRVSLKKVDIGPKRSITHGEGGGTRTIHFEERPGFLAKNRYQMPDSVEYKIGHGYEALAKYFPQPTGKKQQAA